MRLPFYIAGRYLFAKKSHNVINLISAISAIGIATGTAALILILSVYNGFDRIIQDSMSDIDPDIVISQVDGRCFDPDSLDLNPILSNPQISSVCKVIQDNVFLRYAENQAIAIAKGVDEGFEQDTPLSRHIRSGELNLMRGEVPQCLVGAGLAHKLRLNPSFTDMLEVYYPDRTSSISIQNPLSSLKSIKARPSAVFAISTDIDNQLIILPISQMRRLLSYEDEVSSIEVRFNPLSQKESKKLVSELRSMLPQELQILDRYQQHPAIYKMMRYEKAAIFLILLFVVIIVAFNIHGSMSMLIIEKKKDISTLSSLGATESMIEKIFRIEGWMISMSGMAAGIITGVALALMQQHFGLIKMPGNYLVSAYPVILKLTDIAMATICIAAIGWLISLLSTAVLRRVAADPEQQG